MTPAAAAMLWFWQGWLAAIVFVFPMPHTVALRNLLLLAGLLALLATWRAAPRPTLLPALKSAAWGLLATTAWLVLHSLAIAPAPPVALENLRGDWLLPVLTAVLAAFAAARTGARPALRATVAALLAHMVWMLGWQVWQWFAMGASATWPAGSVPFGGRDFQSSLNVFLLAILLADRLAVLSVGPPAALFPAGPVWAALGIALVADAALRVRNGTVVGVVLFLAATVWLARQRSRSKLLLLAVAALLGASFALEPRWSGLIESLAVGWNSPSLYWLSEDPTVRPLTPSGGQIEESAYARAAWAHQAVRGIGEHPLGLGFGRDGFGRVIAERYGFRGMVSSHSGWLDFALGAGLPGLGLLLITATLAIRGGWRHFREHDDSVGLMFCFLVGGYLLRCLLDGHLSGWRLGLFAFICGVLIGNMREKRAVT